MYGVVYGCSALLLLYRGNIPDQSELLDKDDISMLKRYTLASQVCAAPRMGRWCGEECFTVSAVLPSPPLPPPPFLPSPFSPSLLCSVWSCLLWSPTMSLMTEMTLSSTTFAGCTCTTIGRIGSRWAGWAGLKLHNSICHTVK